MNLVEEAVISGILQHGEDALIDVSDLISIDSFTVKKNQTLFKVLQKILQNNLEIDTPTIDGYATSLNLEIDFKEVDRLLQEKIDLNNVRQHAKTLMKKELIKNLKSAHRETFQNLDRLTGTEPVDQILTASEDAIFQIVNESFENDQPRKIFESPEEYLKSKEENKGKMLGLPTPFPKFNTVIGGGIRKGGVTLIGSRAGVGKSTFGKEVGMHLVDQEIPVLYLDTEMTEQEQLDRCIASKTEIDISDIETGDFYNREMDKTKVVNCVKELKNLPYYHKYIGGRPFQEVLSTIRRWVIKHVGFNENGSINDCLVIYDYFKLMDSDKLEDMQEYQALGFQISELTDFCKEYQLPCLSFVQLNRDGIDKDSQGTIAQSDRLVWLCLSLALFKAKTQEEMAESGEYGNMKLIPIKARFGSGMDPGDYINLHFTKRKSIIKEGETYFSIKKKINNAEWSSE